MRRHNRFNWQRWVLTTIFGPLTAASAQATEVKVLSLNLHGYHPMGESERHLQTRDMKITAANSDLSYFSLDELERGQSRQLNAVRDAVAVLAPQVVLLQEVGAGLPSSAKDCNEFLNARQPYRFGTNSAVRLRQRLRDMGFTYDLALACRGNIGWWTSSDSFKNSRVVTFDEKSKAANVVFDFNSNPYPGGMIVEGTAILVGAPWKIAEERVWRLPVHSTGEEFFFQTAKIEHETTGRWMLVANLHGGHKVRHFEQATAVREALAEYVLQDSRKTSFAGVIVGGDFNARIYRPNSSWGEVSTVPWEISVEGEYDFGVNSGPESMETLNSRLWDLNIDTNYKPWASVGDSEQARARVRSAVERFFDFVKSPLSRVFQLSEALEIVKNNGLCAAPLINDFEATCPGKTRIDLVYSSETIRPEGGAVVFSKNNYRSLKGPSDHPGIYLKLRTK